MVGAWPEGSANHLRFEAALDDLIAELERRGGLPPPPRADGVAHGYPDRREDVCDEYADDSQD